MSTDSRKNWSENPPIWLPSRSHPLFGVRFGRTRGIFSERYQGTRGIPIRHFYFFGGRLTFIKPRKRAPEVEQ